MNENIREEFKQKLKEFEKVSNEQPVVEFCSISDEELSYLSEFFSREERVLWNLYIKNEVKSSGYINGKPFVIFSGSDPEKDDALVMEDRIVKFKSGKVQSISSLNDEIIDLLFENRKNYEIIRRANRPEYAEVIIDKNYAFGTTKNRLNGYFALPRTTRTSSLSMEYDLGGGYISYIQKVACDLDNCSYPEFHVSDIESRNVHEELKVQKLAATVDKPNNIYYVDSMYTEILADKKTFGNNGICNAVYPSVEYYNEGKLPFIISFNSGRKERFEQIKYNSFILLADGRYIDIEVYKKEGLEAAITTIEKINEMLSKVNLSVKISEKLKEIHLSDDFVPKDLVQVVSESRAR